MAEAQRLAKRALQPWLQRAARRPMPKGKPGAQRGESPWMSFAGSAQAMAQLNGDTTFTERLSETWMILDDVWWLEMCFVVKVYNVW